MTFHVGDTVQVKDGAAYGLKHAEKAFQDSGRFGVVEEIDSSGWIRVVAANQKDWEWFVESELTLIEHAQEQAE